MHHHRLLDALDSSSLLLFIEALYGSGTTTALPCRCVQGVDAPTRSRKVWRHRRATFTHTFLSKKV